MADKRQRFKRPHLFKNKATAKSSMQNVGQALVADTLKVGFKAVKDAHQDNVSARMTPKYLQVTEKRLEHMGVIDLKKYFAMSAARKESKSGGWYVVVPIRMTKRKGMSRRAYEQLRAVPTEPGQSKTVVSDYLYDRRRASQVTELNYEPVSNNVTKTTGKGGRSTYVAYRTVSDKSPANSWIINRGKVNTDDTSKTFVKRVGQLMRWKMRNM